MKTNGTWSFIYYNMRQQKIFSKIHKTHEAKCYGESKKSIGHLCENQDNDIGYIVHFKFLFQNCLSELMVLLSTMTLFLQHHIIGTTCNWRYNFKTTPKSDCMFRFRVIK